MQHGERLNGYTHLSGTLLAVAGAAVLVVRTAFTGDAWKIVAASVYAATLLLLYLFSTLYHGLADGTAKRVFRKLDHIAIYLLIAGTYTPFTLVTLRGAWGWSLFGIVWGLAAAGIVLDALHRAGLRWLQMAIYLVMGWLVVIAWPQLAAALPAAGIGWLVAGGIIYTLGTLFYALDSRLRHAHGIWHLFVMAGSACHYVAVFAYVV
ncbi:MAG TPA: hemolysin III family protein [Mariprofundaceae bacterium]|nr:hemolysin III family protein [Mariprofundaceae bacterium]